MSLPSIANQVDYALAKITWDKEQIRAYQTEQGVTSVKRSLRPGGDPTRPLPVILSINTRRTYFQTATLFFKRAEEISGKGKLADLLDQDIFVTTFEEHYVDAAPGTVNKLLAAIEKVHLGCTRLGWVDTPCLITPELRDWVKSFRDDSDVRMPRFGYRPEDAARVLAFLQDGSRNSAYALPAELALRCGLREDEIAGLKGENIDLEQQVLHITGKGGRYRPVQAPPDLLARLNCSKQYLFTPSASWRAGFRRTVREATRMLGIEISGVHRLRSNFSQNQYQQALVAGMNEREARQRVSKLLGHARTDVTYKYMPKGFEQKRHRTIPTGLLYWYTIPMIVMTPSITIEESELQFEFSRAGGPGGQNVNKVESAVKLRFDVRNSPSLPEDVKERLVAAAGSRMTDEGVLLIRSSNHRTQELNRAEALLRFEEMVRLAAKKPKPRRPTKPSVTAKAARVGSKKRRGHLKQSRRGVEEEWED